MESDETFNYMFARMENVFSNGCSLITISESMCRRNTCEIYDTGLSCINRKMANMISQSPTHKGFLYTVTENIGLLRNSCRFSNLYVITAIISLRFSGKMKINQLVHFFKFSIFRNLVFLY